MTGSDLPDSSIPTAGYEYNFVYSTRSIEDGDLIAFAQSRDVHQVVQFPAGDAHLVAADLTQRHMEISHIIVSLWVYRSIGL